MVKEFEYKDCSHTVLKNDDIAEALTEEEITKLDELIVKVSNYRRSHGKEWAPTYYVVNLDEPYSGLIIEIIKWGEQAKERGLLK